MRLLRHPRTPLEILIQGTALVMGIGVLIAVMFALYVLASAFAVAAFALALIFVWELAVERPRRKARRAAALAAQSRPVEEIPLRTRAAPRHWSDRLPGPLGTVVRTAPATLVAVVIVGVALGVNSLLGDLINPDTDDGVYVLLQTGSSGDLKQEEDRSQSLRVTLLSVEQWGGHPTNGMKYWGAEVEVQNIGTEASASPAWMLRAGGKDYDPATADAPGEILGDSFTLPRGEARTGWLVFEVALVDEPQWLRAYLPDYPDLYFAIRSIYEEKVSRWERAGATD